MKNKNNLKDEVSKFTDDKYYHKYKNNLLKSKVTKDDILHHFPAFCGVVNISRILAIYETFKKVQGNQGHIAEIGVWKGSSFLLFTKLVSIFEPYSNTIVHGFENFKGMKPNSEEKQYIKNRSYISNYNDLKKLIKVQKLDHIAKLHKLDVTKELNIFSKKYKSTSFKLVYFDAGVYEVVKTALPFFWERLLPGGIMLFDQFNYEVAHGETIAVREILPKVRIKNFSWSRTPSGYIIKE